jgi:hypothetical protein
MKNQSQNTTPIPASNKRQPAEHQVKCQVVGCQPVERQVAERKVAECQPAGNYPEGVTDPSLGSPSNARRTPGPDTRTAYPERVPQRVDPNSTRDSGTPSAYEESIGRTLGCASLRSTTPGWDLKPLRGKRCALAAVIFLLILAFPHGVFAQNNDVDESEKRRVYVPVEDLDTVLARDQQGVLLTQNEFTALLAKAKTNTPEKRQPAAIVVSSAEYSASISGDHLLLNATISFRQFDKGWHTLALPYTNLAVESATVNGKPAQLARQTVAAKGKGQSTTSMLVLFHNEPGTAELKLAFSTVLESVGNDRAARFGLLPVPSATIDVNVPAGRHLQVGSQTLERPAAEDQPAVYQLPVGGTRDLLLLFNDEQDEQRTDSLTFATTGYGLNVAPGEVTWQASTSLQVYGTTLNQLLCTVPNSLEITDVESTGLESWELSDDPDNAEQTLITLNYRQPFDGRRDVTFRGVLSTGYGQVWAVPSLTIRSVTSHIGRVVIQHPPGVRLRVLESAGTRTSGGEAGSLTFDAWRENFRLALETRTRERELHASVSTILDLGETSLTFYGVTQFETHFEPLFEVGFRLAAEWELESVSVNGKPSTNWKLSSREAGWNDYRVPLPTALKPGEEATFTFSARQQLEGWPVEDEPIDLTLPTVQIEEASIVEGSFVLKAGEDLDLELGDLTGFDPARTGVPGERLGFVFQSAEHSGQVTVTRRPSRVTASTLAFTRLDREVLNSHLQVTLDIAGGGLRELNIGLSESAGEELRFRLLGRPLKKGSDPLEGSQIQGTPGSPERVRPLFQRTAGIVEQRADDPENGVRNWTLILDRRLRGEIVLAVDVVTPRGADTEFAAHQVTIPGAERVSGFVAFEAAAEQQLNLKSADIAGLPLSSVDPVDVPPPFSYVPQQRIVEAFRYHVPGYSVTLSEKRFERVAVPTAVCYRSLQQTVVGSTGELQHEAQFEFIAVGAQSLLVLLPEPTADSNPENLTELWAVKIDGSPVEVRRTPAGFLVPLPTAASPDARRTLQLFYRTRMPALTNTGEFDESPPQITVVHSSGNPQPLEMLDQYWRLHYPSEMTIVDSDGDFQPEERIQTTSVLGNLRDSFTKVDRQNLQKNGIIAAVLIVLVGGIALSLRKLGVGMVGCFGSAVTMLVFAGWLMTSMQSGMETDVADRASSLESYFASPPGAPSGFADQSDDGDCEAIDFSHVTAGTNKVLMELHSMDEAEEITPSEGGDGERFRLETTAESPKSQSTADPFTRNQPGSILDDLEARIQIKGQRAPPSGGVPILNKIPNVDGRFGEPLPPQRSAPGAGFGGAPSNRTQDDKIQALDTFQALKAVIGHKHPNVGEDRPLLAQNGRFPVPEIVGVRGAQGTSTNFGRGGEGARLSLALELQVPQDALHRDFRYTGNRTAASDIALRVSWHNGDAASLARLFLIAAVTLLLWLTLGASFKTRAILVTLGMTLPLALVSVAPSNLHNVLDGVFLGSALTLGLWLLRGLLIGLKSCGCCERWLAKCCRPKATAGLVLLASSLALATSAQAQLEPPFEKSATPSKQAANAQPEVARPTGVIIPYEAGTDPTQAGRVLLTREHFLKLWNRANPERKLKDAAPVQGLVADAFYRCSLVPGQAGDAATDTVAVEATIILHSFRDGQLTLPLNLGSIALSEAKLDGETAPLRVQTGSKSGPTLDVVLESRGQHVLDLKFNVPAKLSGKVGQFTLPVMPVPSGRVVFQLPETGLSVRVNGSTSLYRLAKTGEGDAATESISVPAPQRSQLTIAWRPPEVQGAVDAIVQIETKTAVAVEDAGIAQASQTTVRVPQGSIADLSFDLPQGLSIRGISGPHMAGWELNEENNQRRLRVFFSPAITESTTINLDLFLDRKIGDTESAIEIATPAPLQVTRESEVIAVFSSDTFQVRSGQSDKVTRIDVATNAGLLPQRPKSAGSSSAPRVAWRHVERPYQAQFIVGRQAPKTTATVQHAVRVSRRKIEISSIMAATLNGAPRASISFELPEGYLLINVNATSMQDWFVTESDGTNPRTLTVEFDRPLTGQIEVILKGHLAKEPDDLLVEVFVPEPFEVSTQTTWAAVWIDDGYTATQTGLTGFKSIDPDQVPATLRGRQNQPLQYAFRSTESESRLIEFETIKATPDLKADSIVVVSVTDSFLDYTFALNWTIENAAVDSFSFLTPRTLNGVSLADKLKFTGERIRESSHEEVGENLRWTITLHDAARDRYFLLATATLPPAEKQLDAPGIRFVAPLIDEFGETIDFAEVERQKQYVMLVNQSQAQLVAGSRPSTIEEVDSRSLPIQLEQDMINQAAETLRVRDAAAQPSWTVRRLAQQSGAPASVNLADLTLVIAADGTWRGQAVYTIRNRRRQFLAVRMPDKSQLLSLFVKGRPARPVTTAIGEKAVQLIALPRQSDADLSFQVKLVYTGSFDKPLPRGFVSSGRDLDLPAPHVVTQKESTEYGIPVARTLWSVYLPDSVDASVIEDAAKTNLRPAKGEAQKAHVRTLLHDFEQLLAVAANDENSARRRMQATNNLKQIGLALHNYHEGNLSGKELSAVQDAQVAIAQQEPIVGIDLQGGTDTVLGAADFDSGKQRQDAINSRNTLLYGNNFNNDINYSGIVDGTSNTLQPGDGETGEGQDVGRGELGFKLNIVVQDPLVSDKPGESTPGEGKPGEGKPGVFKPGEKQPGTNKSGPPARPQPQKKSVSRAARRQQSISNLATLNDQVEQKMGSPLPPFGSVPGQGQQGQQGQQGGGRQQTRNAPAVPGFSMPQTGPSFGGALGGQAPATPGNAVNPFKTSEEFSRPRSRLPHPGPMVDGPGSGLIPMLAQGERGSRTAGDGVSFVANTGYVAAWTSVGGLSLPVDLPASGTLLQFTKVSGEPKLALRVRSKELVDRSFGLIWTVVWLAVATTLVVLFNRLAGRADFLKPVGRLLFAVGLVSFVALTGPLSGIGFVCFLAGLVLVAVEVVRSRQPAV